MNTFIEFAMEYASAWAPWMLDATIKSVALVIVVGVTITAMRRTSAATRHLGWSLVLGAMLLLPVASAALPAWRILPAWARSEAPTSILTESSHAGHDVVDQTDERASNSDRVSASDTSIDAPPVIVPASTHMPTTAEHASGVVDAVVPPAATFDPIPAAAPERHESPQPDSRALSVTHWAFGVWATGVILCLVPILLGRASVRRLARTSQRVGDGEWVTLARQAAQSLGIRRRVVLLKSSAEPMPLIYGIFRVTIVIPLSADDWSMDRRWAVLLHELAHARRHDCLTRLIGRLACALYWFNPLCWLALRRMHSEAEVACDDLVLASGQRSSDYATHLVEIASGLKEGTLAAYGSIAMARRSTLEGRMRAILDARRNRRAWTRLGVVVAMVVLAGVVLPLAMVGPADAGSIVPGPTEVDRQTPRQVAEAALTACILGEFEHATALMSKQSRPGLPEMLMMPALLAPIDKLYVQALHVADTQAIAYTNAFEFAIPGEASDYHIVLTLSKSDAGWRITDVDGLPTNQFEKLARFIDWFKDRHGNVIVDQPADNTPLAARIPQAKRGPRPHHVFRAIYRADPQQLTKLLNAHPKWVQQSYANISDWLSSPLHAAVRLLHFPTPEEDARPEIIRVLLKHKASLTAVDDDGNTLLHSLASVADQTDHPIVLELADAARRAGVDVNHTGGGRATALIRLCESHRRADHNLRFAQWLLSHGANPNIITASNMKSTSLHRAIEFADLPMTRLLLKHNADLTLTNSQGMTPLHIAAGEHMNVGSADEATARHDLVELLLEHGADPWVITRGPFHEAPVRPIHLARPHPQVQQLLREAMDPKREAYEGPVRQAAAKFLQAIVDGDDEATASQTFGVISRFPRHSFLTRELPKHAAKLRKVFAEEPNAMTRITEIDVRGRFAMARVDWPAKSAQRYVLIEMAFDSTRWAVLGVRPDRKSAHWPIGSLFQSWDTEYSAFLNMLVYAASGEIPTSAAGGSIPSGVTGLEFGIEDGLLAVYRGNVRYVLRPDVVLIFDSDRYFLRANSSYSFMGEVTLKDGQAVWETKDGPRTIKTVNDEVQIVDANGAIIARGARLPIKFESPDPPVAEKPTQSNNPPPPGPPPVDPFVELMAQVTGRSADQAYIPLRRAFWNDEYMPLLKVMDQQGADGVPPMTDYRFAKFKARTWATRIQRDSGAESEPTARACIQAFETAHRLAPSRFERGWLFLLWNDLLARREAIPHSTMMQSASPFRQALTEAEQAALDDQSIRLRAALHEALPLNEEINPLPKDRRDAFVDMVVNEYRKLAAIAVPEDHFRRLLRGLPAFARHVLRAETIEKIENHQLGMEFYLWRAIAGPPLDAIDVQVRDERAALAAKMLDQHFDAKMSSHPVSELAPPPTSVWWRQFYTDHASNVWFVDLQAMPSRAIWKKALSGATEWTEKMAKSTISDLDGFAEHRDELEAELDDLHANEEWIARRLNSRLESLTRRNRFHTFLVKQRVILAMLHDSRSVPVHLAVPERRFMGGGHGGTKYVVPFYNLRNTQPI
ncbi:MAG: hypothetical protein CMJ49_09945 [Planctomycetaceae bacterium]|nr:hypothetical protein [Planctomycetaceae bacterium]